MKTTNTLSPTGGSKKDKKPFSAAIQGNSLQGLIRKSVPTPADAARLTGTLISAVAASQNLQLCEPATIVAAALRGEGMGFVLGRDYYIVPFGKTAVYVPGYKGLLNLLLATGEVADADCVPVREGEILGRDRRTKRLKFDFSFYQTDEEANAHPVVGYYAYVELLTGYFRYEYMSVEEILDHAERYSKSFDRGTYLRLQNGDCSAEEAEKLREKSTWYSAPETMMKKTVMRRLLNSGYVPLANSAKLRNELAADTAADSGELLPNLNLGSGVDQSTGEVIETSGTVEDSDTPEKSQEATKATGGSQPTRRAKKATAATAAAEEAPSEGETEDNGEFDENDFFGR